MKKLWIDNNIVFIVETCNNKYVADQKKGRRREGNKKGKLERKRHICRCRKGINWAYGTYNFNWTMHKNNTGIRIEL